MATTDFVSGVTLSNTGWADDVDSTAYSVLVSVAGTNTITATGPANYAYAAARTPLYFIPAVTNTGATTINVTPSGGSALGARNIFRNGAACIGGELIANIPVALIDDGTQFHIIGSGVQHNGVLHVDTGVGTGCAADTNENDLKTYTIPAGTLARDGDEIRFMAEFRTDSGSGGGNTRIRIYFGATVIADSTDTTFNSYYVRVKGEIRRTGATTQTAIVHASSTLGNQAWKTADAGAVNFTAPGETLSGAIVLKSTVQQTATAGVNQAIQDFFVVEYIRRP